MRQLGCWLVWLCFCASSATAADPLLLRTAMQSGSIAKYAPSDAALPGICLEILRAVERIDPGLRFVGLDLSAPLRRVERMLAQGELDVFFCLLKSPERLQQWRYASAPLYRIRHRAVQRVADATELRGMPDLVEAGLKKPVLVTNGTVLAQTLANAKVRTASAPSEREALQMLLLGRTDVVYGQDLSLLRNLREASLEDRLRLSPVIFMEDIQYLAVAKQVPPEVEQRLNQALQTLERTGALKSIVEKYQ